MADLNNLGGQFARHLTQARDTTRARDAASVKAEKVHVVGAGGTVTAVYEQLRNAAEYTEEHLLLARAIRRFYRRLFLTRDRGQVEASGDELIVELTLAGYLQNDTISMPTARRISALATEYFDAALAIPAGKYHDSWTVDVLAVEVERLLSNHDNQEALVALTHQHFASTLDTKKMFGEKPQDFEVALLVAIHRALLHSDSATIRATLLRRYGMSPAKNLEYYRATNANIDTLLGSPVVEKLFRAVNRQGAPFRVLHRMIEDQPNMIEFLPVRDKFLRAYETQINHEYERIGKRINRGIVKSVLFLIITKFLVGIAIEVPYDYLVHGSIVWLPLIINLLFPPIYMILLRATLMIPGPANTSAMVDQIDHFFYGTESRVSLSRRSSRSFGVAYNFVYALFFIAVFGGVSWFLVSLGFSLLHLFIFFVFLSTASFLGFRLSGMVRELEVVDSNQGGIIVIRDFLYMPFVVVGRWISEKYSRMNIVAMFLDMVIELPLKTVLRLVRQWSAFISSKKDEL